ncbi:MAG: DegT/DnrJ/EryC1/StrS family aminotransferase, partial [Flavobacteriales bacterium]
MFERIIEQIREIYKTSDFIPLHVPTLQGNEKKYLNECIDSTFVSSVGKFVDLFEEKIQEYTGAKKAIVCVNGTNALHICLELVGVKQNDEVITQPLTFIATANAISYANAVPLFIDVDKDTMGLSPKALKKYLEENGEVRNNECFNKLTGRRIKACMPMHTFGHACRIEEIAEICKMYHIELVEDAAEAMGAKSNGKHLGLFGKVAAISFNGNKVMTTGGGGVIITNDEKLGEKAKHITTQAKIPHPWEYDHDTIGY